ncbi:hypothetical protein E4H12_14875 [Candidatus Thorarchaeota archaeon]|nr:MAG: hypothetical protein E4H12_14875 [Candidatus Thorarchaeota archaeon]
MKIVYDPVLKRPGCALLQAAYGADGGAANYFNIDHWLLAPTPDMALYEVTVKQLTQVVAITEQANEEMK